MAITPEQYEAAIPECCEYHTLDEHMNGLLLCWGLRLAAEEGRAMDCTGCELATRKVGAGATPQDLSKCPGCGGDADNGHDRCAPPNPYYCKRCNERPNVKLTGGHENG
jgi:hypothetical protein